VLVCARERKCTRERQRAREREGERETCGFEGSECMVPDTAVGVCVCVPVRSSSSVALHPQSTPQNSTVVICMHTNKQTRQDQNECIHAFLMQLEHRILDTPEGLAQQRWRQRGSCSASFAKVCRRNIERGRWKERTAERARRKRSSQHAQVECAHRCVAS